MSESDKIQTIFKRALGVVSSFKDTPWYNEINGRQRNIVEAKDINIEKTPQTPVWSETSLNYTTMATLGFDLSSSDFATDDISFTDLHTSSDNGDGTRTYKIDDTKLPGMYLDESVSDSSGVVALFVRLKLDKMEGDENLDPSAIAYTKYNSSTNYNSSNQNLISNGDFEILSDSIKSSSAYETYGTYYINSKLIGWETPAELESFEGFPGDGSGGIIIATDMNSDFETTAGPSPYSGNHFIGIQNRKDRNNYDRYISKTVVLRSGKHILSYAIASRDYSGNTPTFELTISYVNTSGTTQELVDVSNTLGEGDVWDPSSVSFDLPYASSVTIQFKNITDDGDTMFFLDAVELLKVPSILSDAYEFNYNSQLNVDSGIQVFKPYNYTLEHSLDEMNFSTVEHSNGNWIFDNETGFITFEDDPSIDLSNGSLYFTFVKYVGVQGLENLMYYNNGKIGIGNKDPQSELDISGSVNITGDLDIDNNLKIGGGTMFVDSSNSCVGINKLNPSSTLDVSGNVAVSNSLTINNGFGNGGGFCPIGTIIMWPTSEGPTYSDFFGDWHLCDGADISSSDYKDLSNVLGSSSNKIALPDFTNRFIKGAKSGDTIISRSGNNTASFDICLNHIPNHQHNMEHTHEISGNDEHTHQTKEHTHNIADINGHRHTTQGHAHDISAIAHSHTLNSHVHNIIDGGHDHGINSHSHTFDANHYHSYTRPNINAAQNIQVGQRESQTNAVVGLKATYYDTDITSTRTDAAGNHTISETDISSGAPNSFSSTISVVSSTVTTDASHSEIIMVESGEGDTTNISSGDLKSNVNINSAVVGSTETTHANIASNVNIDNHAITTNANSSAGNTINMNCVVNPLFHSLFFFIRIA